MNIIKAKYYKAIPDGTENIGVLVTIDGIEMSVPLDPSNRHFAEIMHQLAAGELTIEEAE